MQLSARLTINLLVRVIEANTELIADELTTQLVDQYIDLYKQYDLESPSLEYLLSKQGFDVKYILALAQPGQPGMGYGGSVEQMQSLRQPLRVWYQPGMEQGGQGTIVSV